MLCTHSIHKFDIVMHISTKTWKYQTSPASLTYSYFKWIILYSTLALRNIVKWHFGQPMKLVMDIISNKQYGKILWAYWDMVGLCDKCAVAWRQGGSTVVADNTITCCHEVPYVFVWCYRCIGVPGGWSYGTTLVRNSTCLGVRRHGGME